MGLRPLSGLVVAVLLVAQGGCGSSGANQLLNAALNVGVAAAITAVAVATAPKSCDMGCSQGMACNEQIGTCQPLPCHDRCLANEDCVDVYGKETCMPRSYLDEVAATPGEAPAPSAGVSTTPGEAPAPSVGASTRSGEAPAPSAGASAKAVAADPCGGLCFTGERCRVEGGVADCVRAAP